MIDIKTILSVFDTKGTLLKKLEELRKALEKTALVSINLIAVGESSIQFGFTFADGQTVYSDAVDISVLTNVTVEQLFDKIKGSDTVIVDVNEAGDALEIHLDADVINKLNRAFLMPVTPVTEESVPSVLPTGAQGLIPVSELGGGGGGGGGTLYRHCATVNFYNTDNTKGVAVYFTYYSYESTPRNINNTDEILLEIYNNHTTNGEIDASVKEFGETGGAIVCPQIDTTGFTGFSLLFGSTNIEFYRISRDQMINDCSWTEKVVQVI